MGCQARVPLTNVQRAFRGFESPVLGPILLPKKRVLSVIDFTKIMEEESMGLTYRVLSHLENSTSAISIPEPSRQEWAQMLEQLLDVARTQGYLTYSDILEALPQPEHHVADVDQLYAALQAEGIRVVETPAEIAEPQPSLEDELFAELPDLTDIALDDPVRMYLQQIGQVPLPSA